MKDSELDVIRRDYDVLAEDGICQIVASALGTAAGPELSSLIDVARSSQLNITISCYSFSELNERNVGSFAATVMNVEDLQHARRAFQSHFERLKATHIYYFVLQAKSSLGHA